jgi:DNA-binding NarL/FixJ family response regulator
LPPITPLDQETLVRLRELVTTLHEQRGASVPVVDLVRLAQHVRLKAGVTIDFEASEALGQPLVVLRMPSEEQADSSLPAESLKALSKRELEVCGLVAEGLSNKQIAKRLFLSLATIKDHVHRILTKTGLTNRAAVAAAFHGRRPDATSA